MVASDSEKKLLEMKKDRILRAVLLACSFYNVDIPKINFRGCTHEWESDGGIQLAHYHKGIICISERQLKLEHLGSGLEETAVHEVIHHLGFNHKTDAERRSFENRKNQAMRVLWKELSAPLPLIGEKENRIKRAKKIKNNETYKEKMRQELESDVRILISQLDDARGEYRTNILNRIEADKMELERIGHNSSYDGPIRNAADTTEPKKIHIPYAGMTESQIEESRKKLGIENEGKRNKHKDVSVRAATNTLTDKELEELNKKAYENMDTGFGDEHGETRWNTKPQIGESRKNLGTENEGKHKGVSVRAATNTLTDKELEELNKKAYENMDTGFDKEHGETRWNGKKKGLLNRFKEALGIDY